MRASVSHSSSERVERCLTAESGASGRGDRRSGRTARASVTVHAEELVSGKTEPAREQFAQIEDRSIDQCYWVITEEVSERAVSPASKPGLH